MVIKIGETIKLYVERRDETRERLNSTELNGAQDEFHVEGGQSGSKNESDS